MTDTEILDWLSVNCVPHLSPLDNQFILMVRLHEDAEKCTIFKGKNLREAVEIADKGQRDVIVNKKFL